MEFEQGRDFGDEDDFGQMRIRVRTDCPPNVIHFLPRGSRCVDLASGEDRSLEPGYYVNNRYIYMT